MINWLDEFSDNKSSSFAPSKLKRRTEEASTIPNFRHELSLDLRNDDDSDSES
jgi:hypothetical protein